MSFSRADHFFSTVLPGLVVGLPRLHALFATYNTVEGFSDGVPSTKPGLSIQVQEGQLEYSPGTDLVYLPDPFLARIGSMIMDEEARVAQQVLESKLEICKPSEDTPFIAFVYAGLSAYREAIAMAQTIRQSHAAAKIVVVTCDCMLYDKERILKPLLEKKEIDAVVVTSQCGARDFMADIVRQLVHIWPDTVAA